MYLASEVSLRWWIIHGFSNAHFHYQCASTGMDSVTYWHMQYVYVMYYAFSHNAHNYKNKCFTYTSWMCVQIHITDQRGIALIFFKNLSYIANDIYFFCCSLTTSGRKLGWTMNSLNVPLQMSALLFSSVWKQTNVHVLRGYINLLLI